MAAFGHGCLRNFGGEGGLRGGHVNEDTARAEGGERAGGWVEEDGAHVGGVADDGEYDVGAGGDGVGGSSEVGPEVDERLGLGSSAVEDGEGVAGPDEVGAHGLAHDARADPAHTRV